MTFVWKPWDDPALTAKVKEAILDIAEPPCKHCQFWRPHITLVEKTGELYGVRCCAAEDMLHDFSCYVPREEKVG